MNGISICSAFRCLTAESDLEFERERAIVNKRNFDDVQTAIRELGQVNQNLQVEVFESYHFISSFFLFLSTLVF